MSRRSSSAYSRFVDLTYVPDPRKDVIAVYLVERATASRLECLAFLGAVAAEASSGTWVAVTTEHRARVRCSGIVYAYDEVSKIARIAFPAELFEPGNLSQLLTVIAGNSFGLADLSKLKLLDISLPPLLSGAFPGPALGIPGIYGALGLDHESGIPLLGSIIKPKCGLSAEEHAAICHDAWVGEFESSRIDGVDMVKDDEALTHQLAFGSGFYERFDRTVAALRRAEDLTGKRKIYIPNITTSNMSEALRRAEYVAKNGGKAIMIDYILGGGVLLHTIRLAGFGLLIHGHRTMSAALDRATDFGISYRVWAKLFRIVGGDQVHTGTPALGVMSASKGKVLGVMRTVRNEGEESTSDSVSQDFGRLAPVLPVCGAGLDPTLVAKLVEHAGPKIAIFAGGGTHGHPHGTRAGAASMRLAVMAASEKQLFATHVASTGKAWALEGLRFFSSYDKQSPNDQAGENL